jgi:hypothetical protein
LWVEAQLLQLCGIILLNAELFAFQRSLVLGFHGDDVSGPLYLELEDGVARHGHEHDVAWPPQDDMVQSREVNHLKCDCLGVIVARIIESDGQIDLP